MVVVSRQSLRELSKSAELVNQCFADRQAWSLWNLQKKTAGLSGPVMNLRLALGEELGSVFPRSGFLYKAVDPGLSMTMKNLFSKMDSMMDELALQINNYNALVASLKLLEDVKEINKKVAAYIQKLSGSWDLVYGVLVVYSGAVRCLDAGNLAAFNAQYRKKIADMTLLTGSSLNERMAAVSGYSAGGPRRVNYGND